jgi:hypothetical protein
MAHQVVGTPPCMPGQRHADAAGQRELRPVHRARLRHHIEHAPRRGLGACGVGLVHQQGELVAAHTRQHVVGAGSRLYALHHVQQHQVAGFMAQAVVDMLEAVQVHQQQRQPPPLRTRLVGGVGHGARTGCGGWAGR